jgi:hypothetical protein
MIEDSRLHSETPHWVGLLWTRVQPSKDISSCKQQQNSQEKDVHAPGGIQTRNREGSQTHALYCTANGKDVNNL